MITRRGFVAGIIAAVPIGGALITAANNASTAQAAHDSAIRPRAWKKGDPIIKPQTPIYIVGYVAQRTVTIDGSKPVSDKLLRSLGFFPTDRGLPPWVSTYLDNRQSLSVVPGDTLILYWSPLE